MSVDKTTGTGGHTYKRVQYRAKPLHCKKNGHTGVTAPVYIQPRVPPTCTHLVWSAGPDASHVVAAASPGRITRGRGPNEVLLGTCRVLHTVRQPTKLRVRVYAVNLSCASFPVHVVAATQSVTWRGGASARKMVFVMCALGFELH